MTFRRGFHNVHNASGFLFIIWNYIGRKLLEDFKQIEFPFGCSINTNSLFVIKRRLWFFSRDVVW